MIVAGIALAYYVQRHRPREIVQRIEVSGRMAAQKIECPNCSASLDPSSMEVVDGVPSIKCSYCGNSFEVTEEPKW
jgi:transcription elongation factor Elf1